MREKGGAPAGFGSLLSLFLLVLLAGDCAAQKVAITFDDLPLNGDLPAGVTRVEIARETLAVLKKRHVPAVYGFVNARKLEGNADAAEALKLWAAAEPVGNHTYAHMDLNQNPADAFEREIEQNEPVLELVAARDANWHWLRYPYLREGDTVEKRRAVRAYLQAHQYRVAQVTLDWEDFPALQSSSRGPPRVPPMLLSACRTSQSACWPVQEWPSALPLLGPPALPVLPQLLVVVGRSWLPLRVLPLLSVLCSFPLSYAPFLD